MKFEAPSVSKKELDITPYSSYINISEHFLKLPVSGIYISMASNYARQEGDAADTRNWDDYYFSFNQTFALLDADWTDPKRFPKGK